MAGPTVDELMTAMRKDYGEAAVTKADTVIDLERVPTGIFSLDLITGGGFPRGKLSIVYGTESSNKTNTVLKAIASHQRIHPHLKCIFVDMENAFDPVWATKLGVDPKKLVLIQTDYAEEVVDMVDAFLEAEDVGLIAIDSLAAMMTANEGSSSAEKAVVGGNALVVGKLTRKVIKGLAVARREGRAPTVIYINQIRLKIGVMFGNPETLPGGNAPKFAASLSLRFYGKDIIEKHVHPDLACRKETSVIIKKKKVQTTGGTCKFEMAMVGHNGLLAGQCHDYPAIQAYLKQYGWLGKVEGGKGWQLFGEEHDTQKQCMETVYGTVENLDKVKAAIFARAIEEAQGERE